MMLDATQKFNQPLTKDRLLNWHAALFPTGRSGFSKIRVGEWRTGPVQVVSGQMGKETLHFEAPPAERVDHDMELFLNWLNNEETINPVLKAALAHLWFVTIHPFDDGNGSIGSAIADLMLARSEKSSHRFYSLSAQIQIERKSYYAILEQTQKGTLDITAWIKWFFVCLGRAIEGALSSLDTIVHKAQFWEALAETPLNERQRKIINQMLDGFDGKLTSSKWAKITKVFRIPPIEISLSSLNRNLIKNPEGGRSTSYSLVNLNLLCRNLFSKISRLKA